MDINKGPDPDDTDNVTIRKNICMVSDFFYPNMGGIEEHIFNLSQCLLERGNKVVVVTHSYGERKGVRWMTNGLKIYYVPAQVFYNGAILPTLITLLPILREILIREKIEIVHGHGAFSSLAHDALFAGKLLNLKTIFTDHSLFGFADASAIITNRFLEISLSDTDLCICVSHIGKANTVLRANVKGDKVYVIPNAVDTTIFKPLQPREPRPPENRINIMLVSRLVYRKGVDLMAQIIPIICKKHPNVDFYIGGDGPKRILLEEIRDEIGDRVRLFGPLDHSDVRDFLVRGHIFLNTSLTEAYCMAIVEAAACGLQVVSTKVGGIPEVLPPDIILLAEPKVPDLVEALEKAIKARKENTFPDPYIPHERVTFMYNWRDVSARTELVYDRALTEPKMKGLERMQNYYKIGTIIGPLFILVFALGKIIISLCDYFLPKDQIDEAADFPYQIVQEEAMREAARLAQERQRTSAEAKD